MKAGIATFVFVAQSFITTAPPAPPVPAVVVPPVPVVVGVPPAPVVVVVPPVPVVVGVPPAPVVVGVPPAPVVVGVPPAPVVVGVPPAPVVVGVPPVPVPGWPPLAALLPPVPPTESGLVHPAAEAIASASTGTHTPPKSKRPFVLIGSRLPGSIASLNAAVVTIGVQLAGPGEDLRPRLDAGDVLRRGEPAARDEV